MNVLPISAGNMGPAPIQLEVMCATAMKAFTFNQMQPLFAKVCINIYVMCLVGKSFCVFERI